MTLLLFYHGNSFESIYQSAAAIKHVALKDQDQVIPSLHSGALRWKGRRKKIHPRLLQLPPPPPAWSRTHQVAHRSHMRMLFKQLSKHALSSLTPHPKAPPSCCHWKPGAGIPDYLSPHYGDLGKEMQTQCHNNSLSRFLRGSVCVCVWDNRGCLNLCSWHQRALLIKCYRFK